MFSKFQTIMHKEMHCGYEI